MAILKNTTITGTGYIKPASSPVLETKRVVQSFTSVGTTSWVCPATVTSVEVLVVAGGGGGGAGESIGSGPRGGGGAGGLIHRLHYPVVPGTSYTVTVGAGGAGGTGQGNGTQGQNSVFDTLTAVGGGFGAGYSGVDVSPGGSGGSGGGSSYGVNLTNGTAGQGFPGGRGDVLYNGGGSAGAGGGGGAGGPGGTARGNDSGAHGGQGLCIDITGSPVWYAGGGGSSEYPAGAGNFGRGGIGGGGNGRGVGGATTPSAGAANTGGGGGGGGSNSAGAAGGSGVVIIRYLHSETNQDPTGQVLYNTDIEDVVVFDTYRGWMSQDLEKNYAGHNLQGHSQTFTSGESGWEYSGGATGTINSTTAPDETNTGVLLSSGAYIFRSNFPFVQNTRYVESIYFKPAPSGATSFTYNTRLESATYAQVEVNLSTLTISSYTTVIPPEIVPAPNGWYRLIIRGVSNATTNRNAFYVTPVPANSSMYIWGAQIEANVFNPGPYSNNPTTVVPEIPYFQDGYRIHRFTTAGETSFVPALAGNIEVLVVAGGGGGGGGFGTWAAGGGGGAGGLIHREVYPVDAFKRYKVVVGNGGAGGVSSTIGANGENSQFGDLIAIGGGRGARWFGGGDASRAGSGGSGGGGQNASGYFQGGGSIYGQGNAGGNGNRDGQEQAGTAQNSYTGTDASSGAGGGGAGGKGGRPTNNRAGAGGRPVKLDITGNPIDYAGGGGGGGGITGNQGGGTSGGAGGNGSANGTVGTANTGGGGGGGGSIASGSTNGGAGGSGIVVVRYKAGI
jgi:hypothetical protein